MGIVLIANSIVLKKEGVEDIFQRIYMGTQITLTCNPYGIGGISLGFLPMAISQTSTEVQRPLTIVIGGLVTATFFNARGLPISILLEKKFR
jgi:cobalt-zinc-cadmium resistance protein CzcA